MGLYRLCGSAAVKKELRDAFERDSAAVTLSEQLYPDINVITGPREGGGGGRGSPQVPARASHGTTLTSPSAASRRQGSSRITYGSCPRRSSPPPSTTSSWRPWPSDTPGPLQESGTLSPSLTACPMSKRWGAQRQKGGNPTSGKGLGGGSHCHPKPPLQTVLIYRPVSCLGVTSLLKDPPPKHFWRRGCLHIPPISKLLFPPCDLAPVTSGTIRSQIPWGCSPWFCFGRGVRGR